MEHFVRFLLLIALWSCGYAQTVCFDGYVMDKYCIDRGTLLDNNAVKTLEGPDRHSVHCLVDVPICYRSGFEILQDPLPGATTHCRAFQLDQRGNNLVIQIARAIGICGTCGNNGTQRYGFRATIIGTVTAPATQSDPATIAVTSLVPSTPGACLNYGPPPNLNTMCSAATLDTFYLVHGSLMLVGWGFLLPMGVITARLLRHRAHGLWFRIHRGVQSVGSIVATVGWMIAMANFDVFKEFSKRSIHGGAGMLVMVLGLLQPLNAFFRPHIADDGSKTGTRVAWEYMHKGAGYAAAGLALVVVAIGTTLLPRPEDQTLFQVIYAVALVILAGVAAWMFKDKQNYQIAQQVPSKYLHCRDSSIWFLVCARC